MSAGHSHDSHDHPHDHGGHTHTHVPEGPGAARKIVLAMVLTGSFMVVEVIGGLLSGSLALIADAGHMATDFASLLLAYAGIRLGRRPADARRSFGYRRFEVLAAFLNGFTLIALTAWIAFEAVQRLFTPVEVLSGPMMAVAVGGLLVNIAAFAILRRGGADNINVGGAIAHVLGDLLGSLAAIGAAAVIWTTGWTPIDPLLSLVVALLILRSTWQLLRQSTGVLMEGVPAHLDYDAIGRALAALPGVTGVHDLHVWNMSAEGIALSAHIGLAHGDDWPATLAHAKRLLATDYGIRHTTLQPTWPVGPLVGDDRRVIPVVPLGSDP